VTFITAHPTKIANIDWSPAAENELLTCSADGTVKLWDVKASRMEECFLICSVFSATAISYLPGDCANGLSGGQGAVHAFWTGSSGA
jgi:WD40 repeat protein